MADPLFALNLAYLFDGQLAKFSFSGEEARSLAAWGMQNQPPAKTGMVIEKEVQGYARMHSGWRHETNKIFHDMGSAREWLGLPSEDDS